METDVEDEQVVMSDGSEEIHFEPNLVFLRLTDLVRKHYFNYLEKQLQENLSAWTATKVGECREGDLNATYRKCIVEAAELLEDKALKACRMAQLYQRAMLKIIAGVRRSTQECRLETQLQHLLWAEENCNSKGLTKATQTEVLLATTGINTINGAIKEDDNYSEVTATPTLDQKVEVFQQSLNMEKATAVSPKRHHPRQVSRRSQHRREGRISRETMKQQQEATPSETLHCNRPDPMVTRTTSPLLPLNDVETKADDFKDKVDEDNDHIAKELALMFNDEKTELDEIFGIDPNEEPDDPHICSILKEIKNAELSHEKVAKAMKPLNQSDVTRSRIEMPYEPPCSDKRRSVKQPTVEQSNSKDLSKSLWPCELFMQRRRLSDTLSRLVDEDLRWHEIIKWKFNMLFGEDSDDEFAVCSPSIELDEILMSSCIRRISPWLVKHLMKPMSDGLIGNRFLFKKLAKRLARHIVLEQQYPDERHIKLTVENFFCLHQAVRSLDDLEDIPGILS